MKVFIAIGELQMQIEGNYEEVSKFFNECVDDTVTSSEMPDKWPISGRNRDSDNH
jgi:hypothetical protein